MSEKLAEQLLKEKQALTEVVQDLHGQMTAYQELGTPEEISLAIDKATQLVESLNGVDVGEVKTQLEELKGYRELGSLQEVTEALDKSFNLLTAYKDLGSPDEVNEALDGAIKTITDYKELGEVAEIKEVFEKFSTAMITNKCESIATKYNVSTDLTVKLYNKVEDFAVVEELLSESFSTRKTTDKKLAGKETKTEPPKKVSKLNASVISRVAEKINGMN